MRILVMNCGSSSLKFELFELGAADAKANSRVVAEGKIERVGGRGDVRLRGPGLTEVRSTDHVEDFEQATRKALGLLRSAGAWGPTGPEAVGHRVVHGGPSLTDATLIDEDVIGRIEAAGELAPLHNGGALAAIRATRILVGAMVPMVAVFDTGFHRTLPPPAGQYAIAPELAERHSIRRYGFHGIAHRYMSRRCAELLGAPVESTRLVTLQLGNGCSAAAIDGGRSVDTSMGFSPLEGLVMGTRSGDIDPAVVSYLCRREKVDAAEVERWLNRNSGLLGVSGASQDMRELLALAGEGNERAALAVEMFCYRARKYVGAYLAALGGADAVVFGGGIGENAPLVRARICDTMDWCGLRIDPAKNDASRGTEAEIGAPGAPIRSFVIPVHEELLIAQDTAAVLTRGPRTREDA